MATMVKACVLSYFEVGAVYWVTDWRQRTTLMRCEGGSDDHFTLRMRAVNGSVMDWPAKMVKAGPLNQETDTATYERWIGYAGYDDKAGRLFAFRNACDRYHERMANVGLIRTSQDETDEAEEP